MGDIKRPDRFCLLVFGILFRDRVVSSDKSVVLLLVSLVGGISFASTATNVMGRG